MLVLIFLLCTTSLFSYEIHRFEPGVDITSSHITDIECDPATNTIWVATGEVFSGTAFGLNRYRDGEWTRYTDYFSSHLLYEYMCDMEIDQHGGVWIACFPIPFDRGGVLYFDGYNEWVSIDTSWGLPSNPVAVVGIAHEDIWFSQPFNCGIIDPEIWSIKSDTLGLFAEMGRHLSAVTILDSISIFAGFIGRVAIVQRDSFFEVPYDGSECDRPVVTDDDVVCWKVDSIIYCFDTDTIYAYDIPNTFLWGNLIVVDSENTFWYARDNLLAAFNPFSGEYTEYNVVEPRSINFLAVDALGNKWLDGHDGLYVFNEDTIVWSVDESEQVKPSNLEIDCYPNPFNSTLRITAPEKATVTIHDTKGRMVADLGKERLWKAEKDVPSGVYIVRAVVGDVVVDGKAVLIR